MDEEITARQTEAQSRDHASASADEPVDELLIEEISIDGMCGVY